MAKIGIKADRQARRSMKLPAGVTIHRGQFPIGIHDRTLRAGFRACVSVGSMHGGRGVGLPNVHVCEVARNPRFALRLALASAAAKVGGRRGVYEGVKRKRRK